MIEFQIKEDYSLDCLVGNEIVTIRVNLGPGYWNRVIQALKKYDSNIKPSDLGETIEWIYYSHAPHELLEDPEKMKRFGYFQCPVCECVYHTEDFKHQNPCDNCRM